MKETLKQNAFLKNALEKLPGGVFVYRFGDDQILYANQKMVELLDCDDYEDMLNYTKGRFANCIHPDDKDRMVESINQQIAYQKDSTDHLDYRIITKSGKIRYIEDYGQKVNDEEEGDLFYVFMVDKEHVHIHLDETASQLSIRSYVINSIDEAIERGEITVFYQPVIRTLNRSLCSFEALARWNSSEFGFLSPADFIPALEGSHQIHKLDMAILREICKQYRANVTAGKETVPVSFNLSRQDFQMCDMVKFVLDTTAEYEVPHSMVRVEITETTLASDDRLIHEAIIKFQEAGFQVWMDDFGSGYSSLNALKDYTFDKLKIDMAFLSTFSEKSMKIISSIVQMAKRIGIHTLAEGVETEEQFEFLNSIGCEEVQGYYFGKPIPYEESIGQVADKGIRPESREDAEYYGKAGATAVNPDDPFAVVEDDGISYRFVYLNRKYMDILHLAGLRTAEESIDEFNDPKNYLMMASRERLKMAEERGGSIHFAFPYHDNYLSTTLQILSHNRGCRLFRITLEDAMMQLPSPQSDEEKANSVVASDIETREHQILIVDDEPVNLMIMGEILKSDYKLLYAENGQEALELLEKNKGEISAVLLDMVMPVKSGIEVLREIRANADTKFLPVIAMTSAMNLQEQLLTEGVTQMLPKPFESPEIIKAKVGNAITTVHSLLNEMNE